MAGYYETTSLEYVSQCSRNSFMNKLFIIIIIIMYVDSNIRINFIFIFF